MDNLNLRIAGINLELEGCIYDYVRYRLRDYISEGGDAQIKISYEECADIITPSGKQVAKNGYRVFLVDNGYYINYDILENPCGNTALIKADSGWSDISASLSDVESYGGASLSIRCFNMIGEIFKYALIARNGFVVHSSSVSYKNNGILFSAPSGTGKSTHTGLWERVYGDDVKIINDDMPAVRKTDGVWSLCGTPWSGKSERNTNECVPLKAFVFLERGEKNELIKIPSDRAVFLILNQTLLPVYKKLMNQAMDNISDALSAVPCYILKCNISEEAPLIVKEGVFNEDKQ